METAVVVLFFLTRLRERIRGDDTVAIFQKGHPNVKFQIV